MTDPRLTGLTDPRLTPPTSADVAAEARRHVGTIYFRDTCDIFRTERVKSPIGANTGTVDRRRNAAPVPVHTRRLAAQYAAGVTEGFQGRGFDSPDVISSVETELCFPLGTSIAIEDKVRTYPNEGRAARWYTVTTDPDDGTDALMVVVRGVTVGIPDTVIDDA